MNYKECKKCGANKQVAEFSEHKQRVDGLQDWCKECSNKAALELHQRNRVYLNNYKLNLIMNKNYLLDLPLKILQAIKNVYWIFLNQKL